MYRIQTKFPELNEVLFQFVSDVHTLLGDDLIGFYLQGSFAIGDFDEHSDCDFIVAIAQELSDDRVQQIREIHRSIFDTARKWSQSLEGSYFPVSLLRSTANCGVPLWYLDNGHRELELSSHCNSVIVRWVLREKGVVLYGLPPNQLIDPISPDELRRTIFRSIVDAAAIIADHPENYYNRFYQSFFVLQCCRKLRDLYFAENGSKRMGAEWVKSNFDPNWNELIDRSWSGRQNPSVSVNEPPDRDDFEATLKFVEYIRNKAMEYANSIGIIYESKIRS